MNKQEVEALAREAGAVTGVKHVTFCDEGGVVMTLGEVHAFAALVLEKAAQVCDATPPDPFRPSIEAAHALRQIAKGLKQ